MKLYLILPLTSEYNQKLPDTAQNPQTQFYFITIIYKDVVRIKISVRLIPSPRVNDDGKLHWEVLVIIGDNKFEKEACGLLIMASGREGKKPLSSWITPKCSFYPLSSRQLCGQPHRVGKSFCCITWSSPACIFKAKLNWWPLFVDSIPQPVSVQCTAL